MMEINHGKWKEIRKNMKQTLYVGILTGNHAC